MIVYLRKKPPQAVDVLYNNYSAALFGVINRILNNEDIAEEVMQDAFLKIIDKIDTYDASKSRLFTWMMRIARNLAIDKTRSREFSQSARSDSISHHVHGIESSHSQQLQIEDIGVRDLLQQLDNDQQEVMQIVYFDGYSHAEAAEYLNLPLGTVKTRVRSALKKLRTIIGDE